MSKEEIKELLDVCGDAHKRLLDTMASCPADPVTLTRIFNQFSALANMCAAWAHEPSKMTGDTLYARSMAFATLVLDYMQVREEAIAHARESLAVCTAMAAVEFTDEREIN